MRKPVINTSCLLVAAFMIICCVCLGCTKQESQTYTGPLTKMKIGATRDESSTILYTAHQLNYFKQMGLDVELLMFDSGVASVKALNEGLIDLGAASSFVFAANINNHPDMRIVTAISRVNNTYVIARKDKDIRTPADLKHKRIAVTQNSIAEYLLGKYLNSNYLKPGDVSIVYMPPKMMEQEIVAGSIDAVIVWNPTARRIIESLKDNAVSWPAQSDSHYHMTLITRESFIKKESAAMERLIKALIMAEKTIADNPAEIHRNLAKQLGMPEQYFADVWKDNQLTVFLDRSLMLALEDKSRWIQKTRGGPEQKLPNYLDYLYLDALKTVRPESVTIIH